MFAVSEACSLTLIPRSFFKSEFDCRRQRRNRNQVGAALYDSGPTRLMAPFTSLHCLPDK
ncbi:hypothetical protein BYT27DRAFT_7183495 [Phlegmacium glaucopus]|nr:hypothetical protein BYT27DRAFT_7201345 [Phlegmacium glaucopus]KAF8811816.1 hypothetical protein BYT27DRAFT_7183495 [Phlegmacium glaucopus]